LRIVGSPDGRDGSIVIHQDAKLFAAILNDGEQATQSFEKRRKGWLQVVRGSVEANGRLLEAGDGVAMQDEDALAVTAKTDGSEILVFDLP